MCLAIALTGSCALAPVADGATIRSFPITAGGPHAVAPSSDGSSVFVAARDCGYLGRFDTATNAFGVFLSQPSLPCTPDNGPFSAVQGPDGKLYFTIYDTDAVGTAGAVGRVNPNGTNFETKTVGSHPLDITVGSDNNIWFAINGASGTSGKVGRVVPASFALTEFSLPGNPQGPRGIVSGGDGALYVLGGEAGVIWRVTTSGVITGEVATALEGPSFGELGPDGKIWFTFFEGDGVASFDPGDLDLRPDHRGAGESLGCRLRGRRQGVRDTILRKLDRRDRPRAGRLHLATSVDDKRDSRLHRPLP